jgi:hypothetical protein
MRDLKRLEREGGLDGAMEWFVEPRPAEELYDLEADPHETENLADDPAYADTLDRLSEALEQWRSRTDDVGASAEPELVEQWWPDGNQPTTDPPTVIPNVADNPGRTPATDGGHFEGPMTLRLHSSTHGASVIYRVDDGVWQPYTSPIRLEAGTTTLETRACRYGYSESETVTARFDVE